MSDFGTADSRLTMAPEPLLIGIDLFEPSRMRERLDRNPSLAEELFWPGERNYAATQAEPDQCLAARFAAKEAVIKALGLDGFDPLDVEVLGGGEATSVQLHGAAAERAKELGVVITISMSHLSDLAAAVALAQPAGRTDGAP